MLFPTLGFYGDFPDSLLGKHGAPTTCPLDGCGVGLFPRFLGFNVVGAAKLAVVPPACLGLRLSMIGCLGMKVIRRGPPVTPPQK